MLTGTGKDAVIQPTLIHALQADPGVPLRCRGLDDSSADTPVRHETGRLAARVNRLCEGSLAPAGVTGKASATPRAVQAASFSFLGGGTRPRAGGGGCLFHFHANRNGGALSSPA